MISLAGSGPCIILTLFDDYRSSYTNRPITQQEEEEEEEEEEETVVTQHNSRSRSKSRGRFSKQATKQQPTISNNIFVKF
ncbi:hypothetical protein M0804_002645 [Polistes exclamans]|nr:hypothetical protein M0804_002645 [Polistes exclamans]